jgi:hypothetical protein
MTRFGAITFFDLDGKLSILRVACHKCDRAGKYSEAKAKLIERYGPDAKLVDWKDELTLACPRRGNDLVALFDPCGAHFPISKRYPRTPALCARWTSQLRFVADPYRPRGAPRSGPNVTRSTRSPPSIADWSSRSLELCQDAHTGHVASHETRGVPYDAVKLMSRDYLWAILFVERG